MKNVEDILIDTLVGDDAWGNQSWVDPVGRVTTALRRRRRRRIAAAVTATTAIAAVATIGMAQLTTGGDAVIRPTGPGQPFPTTRPTIPTPDQRGAAAAHAAQQAAAAAAQASAAASSALPLGGKCCVAPPEPALRINVSPKSGPPGTVVHILITGCGLASPQDEATVSFNNDALNTSARNDPNTVRDLGIHHGTRIRFTYTIVTADNTGGTGRFFVQCGDTVLDTPFRVSG